MKNNSPGAPKEINTVTLTTSINSKDNIGNRWYLRGCVNRKLAEVIVHFIKDMASVSEFLYSAVFRFLSKIVLLFVLG